MPFLSVPGAQIYYEVHGSGPPLVFAHGLGGNHLTWWQQVPHFRDRYTCVVYATRGFGNSTVDGEIDPAQYPDDLRALVDHLGFDRVNLVGQSMGGWTCLPFALRYPQRTRAVVMAATVGTFADAEVDRLMAANRERAAEKNLFARNIHPACGERMAREQPALHFLYQQVGRLSIDLDTESLRARLMAARTTTAAQLAEMRVPTLCIAGAEDIVIPAAAVARLAAALPNARYEEIPAAGHSVYFERASMFNAAVDAFLGEPKEGVS